MLYEFLLALEITRMRMDKPVLSASDEHTNILYDPINETVIVSLVYNNAVYRREIISLAEITNFSNILKRKYGIG